tara:strand:- start:240 stop:704 length:465 start_codon:yes stop_codon:yes gene_type:complete
MRKIKMVTHGTNMPLPIGGGTLTLCGINDFRDTLRGYHTVVTFCKYEPQYTNSDTNERHHYYFRCFYDTPERWRGGVALVEELLSQGKDVLMHCLHGKDRTGGVAYAILRNTGKGHREACTLLNKIRPRMALEWKTIMKDRRAFHESLMWGEEE